MVARAAAAGVHTLALTDHDTFAGLEEARVSAEASGVRLISGVEVTTRAAAGSAHVIALFPAEPPESMREALADLRDARDARARVMVERLAAVGAPVDFEDVATRARGAIGRPHVADALVAAGHASDRADAFARLIGHDGPGYVPHSALPTRDAVALIAASGGAAVLAHPGTLRLGPRHLESVVASLASAGLAGIEVHRPEHTPDQRADYAALARRHRLTAAGGSDFHRPVDGLEPGRTGDPPLPAGTADRLLAVAGRRATPLR